jgi:hypothetical protein
VPPELSRSVLTGTYPILNETDRDMADKEMYIKLLPNNLKIRHHIEVIDAEGKVIF